MTTVTHPYFREAVRPPARTTVSEWADAHVHLPPEITAESGPWRTARVPYMREPMDSIRDPMVRELTLMTASQVAKTACLVNQIGYAVCEDPGPALFVMPNDDEAEKMMRGRIQPIVEASPAIRAHLTGRPWDVQARFITFDRMALWTASARSPAELASRAIRYVWCDEVDKYGRFTQVESDPISLARKRLDTFLHRARLVLCSTPTNESGLIWQSFSASDRRHCWVPCPKCDTFQVLDWSRMKWPHEIHDPQVIDRNGLAWYECCECGAEIRDAQKAQIVARCVWAPDGATVRAGVVEGAPPEPLPHRGYHLSSLYSPWVPWPKLVREWLEAQGDVAKLLDFTNSRLGLPFRQRVTDMRAEGMARLELSHPRDTVPETAVVLTAGIDVQQDVLYYVVRAWGEGEISWLVRAGKTQGVDWRALTEEVLSAAWGEWQVTLACMDSGYRTGEVYEFARSWPDVLRVTKGRDTLGGLPYTATRIEKHPTTGAVMPDSTVLWHVNTEFFKDRLAYAIAGDEEKGRRLRWWTHKDPGADYVRQMSSEHKVLERNTKGAVTSRWVRKPGHRANHWWDCYSDDTEVLARRGWALFTELRPEDELATVNLATDEIEYQRPTNIIRRKHIGEMMQIGGEKRSRVNLLVTPGHRMVGFKGVNDRTPRIYRADELTIWHRLKMSASWTGSDRDSVPLPAVSRSPARAVDAVELAAFLGWCIAEGSFFTDGRKHRITIYQNPRPKKDLLRQCVARMPWKFHETDRGFVITDPQAFALIADQGTQENRFVPQWIKDASPRIIESFLAAAVLGDGWVDLGKRRYASISGRLADDVGELFIKAGRWASWRDVPARPYRIDGRTGANTRPQVWTFEMRSGGSIHLRDSLNRPNFRRVQYDGDVVCATVPNGTLIVRRGGKAVVCGNCEVLAMVAAHMLGVQNRALREAVGPDRPLEAPPAPQSPAHPQARRRSWVKQGGGWNRRPRGWSR